MPTLRRQGYNFPYIATRHNLREETIDRHMRLAFAGRGLPPPSTWRPKLRDPQAVAKLYRQQRISKTALSKQLGVSLPTLELALRQAEAETRARKHQEPDSGASPKSEGGP